MKLVFVLNFVSVHQVDIADALFSLLGNDFAFISASGPSGYKKGLGDFEHRPYVVRAYENHDEKEKAINFVASAQVCIVGIPASSSLLSRRAGPIIRESEHLFRNPWYFLNPISILRLIHLHFLFRKESKNEGRLLCNSFYSKRDFNRASLYRGATHFFGYFPKGSIGIERPEKNSNVFELLWSGRFLKGKHPESVITCSRALKKAKLPYHITFVGPLTGPVSKQMRTVLKQIASDPNISYLDGVKHEDLMKMMRESDAFLFSSDRSEGFGAVLYEAMSAGCCCLASKTAGGTRLLIKHRGNGLIYSCKGQLAKTIVEVARDRSLRANLGMEAKRFIEKSYSPRKAAENLIKVFLEKSDVNPGEPCAPF